MNDACVFQCILDFMLCPRRSLPFLVLSLSWCSFFFSSFVNALALLFCECQLSYQLLLATRHMLSCTISFWYNFSDSSCCHYILLRLSERDGCLSSSSSKVVIIGLVHPPLKRFRSPPANHLVSTKFSLFPCMRV